MNNKNMNKFKVGDKVRVNDSGKEGIIRKIFIGTNFPYFIPSVGSGEELNGDSRFNDLEVTLIRVGRGRPAKVKPIVALVVWDEDRDPVKEFTKFSQAKKFAKELMGRAEVKKDSVKIYEVKKCYKMVEKKLNKLVQVK